MSETGSRKGALKRLEPDEGKLSRPVLRGGGDRKVISLPDQLAFFRPFFPKNPPISEENRMAEGVGFEPTIQLPVCLISSQVPSTTQPPFPPETEIIHRHIIGNLLCERRHARNRWRSHDRAFGWNVNLKINVSSRFHLWLNLPHIKQCKT